MALGKHQHRIYGATTGQEALIAPVQHLHSWEPNVPAAGVQTGGQVVCVPVAQN